MAYFSISSVSARDVTLYVSPDTGYPYYRIFIRKSSDTAGVVDVIYNLTEGQYLYFTGLEPSTEYTVNVGKRESADGTNIWLGAQTFTTSSGATQTYSVTVYYDANGGIGAPSPTTSTNTATTIPAQLSSGIPTRNGYTFLGWSTSPTATSAMFAPGGTYFLTHGTIILYAVWQSNSGGGGGGTTGTGNVRIWNGSTFREATPYVWNGSTWRKATPHVWNGSTWRKC